MMYNYDSRNAAEVLTPEELDEVQRMFESFPLTPLPLKSSNSRGILTVRFVNPVDAKKFYQLMVKKGFQVGRVVPYRGAYEFEVRPGTN